MIEILAWNDDYDMLPDEVAGVPEIHLVRDRARCTEADAVIFHIPSLRRVPDPDVKPAGQRWVAWSMESDVNYPMLADPTFLDAFDLTMTYRRDADVWVPYLSAEVLDPGPRWMPSAGTDDALAVYVASNPRCPSGRDDYVAELMAHLPVASYGRCLNNRTWASDLGRPTKLATFARHPFTLAFENSVSDDYVTEKFFDALCAGSVPIVLGAPNVAEFAPSPESYLDVRDFRDPAALASRIDALRADEAAYASMLRWKAEGASPAFRALAAEIGADPWLRLARRLRST